MNKTIYLLAWLLVAATSALCAQNTPFFITEYGESTPRNMISSANNVAIPGEGDFVQLYTRTALNGKNLDVVLYKYDVGSFNVSDSLYLGDDRDQSAESIRLGDDGFLYVLATNTVLGQGNVSDVVIYKITDELELIETTVFDHSRYDQAHFLGDGGPGRLSMLVSERDEFSASNQYRLITFLLENGEVISEVEVPSNTTSVPRYFLVSDGGENVLLGRFNRFFGQGCLTGVNVEDGSVNFHNENLSEAGCPSFIQLLGSNAIFNPERNVFALTSACGSVLEIDPDDGTENLEILEEPITGINNLAAWAQAAENGLFIYDRSGIYEIVTDADGYSRGTTTIFPSNNLPIPTAPVNAGVYVVNFTAGDPRFIFLEGEGFEIIDVDGFEFTQTGVFTENRFVYYDEVNNELVTVLQQDRKSSALFYDTEGNVLDSLVLSEAPGNGTDVTNFVKGPDGSIVALLTNVIFPAQQSLVRFDRESGIIETMLVIESEEVFPAADNAIESLNDGGYMLLFSKRVNFITNWNFVRLTAAGEIVFSTDLPTDYTAVVGTKEFAVDNAANLYSAEALRDSCRLISIDGEGNYRYDLSMELPAGNLEIMKSVVLNDTEDRLLVSGSISNEEGKNLAYVAEFDPADGSLLREIILNEEESFRNSNAAIYARGSNDILVMNARFRGDELPVNDQIALQFTLIDATGGSFQRDFITGYYGIPTILDLVVSENFEAFACGSSFPEELNTRQAVLVGLSFDDVVSVEPINNLTETSDLNVFPNPTNDFARVQWNNLSVGKYKLELLTNDGHLVTRWQGSLARGQANLDLDLSRLPNGVYLLRLTTESGVSTQKIIKQ